MKPRKPKPSVWAILVRPGLRNARAGMLIAACLALMGCSRPAQKEVQKASSALPSSLVRMQGGTVWERKLEPLLPEVTKRSGVQIELVGNSSGRGLENLCDGKCDIANVVGEVDAIIGVANE